ncbi:hypothetical protein [Streptomyces mirabilis]|uniref:hypothetical protein n=1 Tax=Streptomyces mirabilis TaxID=68239 RepID=UPI0036DDEE99
MWNGLVGVVKEAYTAGLGEGAVPRPVMMPLVRGELVGLIWVRPLKVGQDALAGIAELANIAAAAGADEVVLAWETHDVATACELPIVGPAPCLNMVLASRDRHVLEAGPGAAARRRTGATHPDRGNRIADPPSAGTPPGSALRAERKEAPVIAPPLVGDAEAEFWRDAAERRSAQTCPGKRWTPMAMGVFHPCGTALCHVDLLDLDEQDTRRCDELHTPSEQGPGVAADTDVPVGQQEGLPGSLTRKGGEHRPAQCRPAESDSAGDRPRGNVDTDGEDALVQECPAQPARSAADVQNGAGAALQQGFVGPGGLCVPAVHRQPGPPSVRQP